MAKAIVSLGKSRRKSATEYAISYKVVLDSGQSWVSSLNVAFTRLTTDRLTDFHSQIIAQAAAEGVTLLLTDIEILERSF